MRELDIFYLKKDLELWQKLPLPNFKNNGFNYYKIIDQYFNNLVKNISDYIIFDLIEFENKNKYSYFLNYSYKIVKNHLKIKIILNYTTIEEKELKFFFNISQKFYSEINKLRLVLFDHFK